MGERTRGSEVWFEGKKKKQKNTKEIRKNNNERELNEREDVPKRKE